MSTDWTQKLAWALRDFPDPNLDLLELSRHRAALLGTLDAGAAEATAEVTEEVAVEAPAGATADASSEGPVEAAADPNVDTAAEAPADAVAEVSAEAPVEAAAKAPMDVGARADWVTCSADRVPFPSGASASRAQVDWASHPEVTHPIVKQRYRVDAFDLEATRRLVGELMTECAARFDHDARRMLMWIWRYLPERLASAAGGPGAMASVLPADPRMPNLSVWQRVSFDTALAAAQPSPTFLVLQISPSDGALGEVATLEDLWVASSMATEFAWQALVPILELLGPASILSPSLRCHPKLDAWLAEQGVTSSEGTVPPAMSAAVAGWMPSTVVALVPGDRVKELGEACTARFDACRSRVVDAVREKLENAGWAKSDQEVWSGVWSRQARRSWQAHWTAVAWSDDSSGAGSLLPKQEVTTQEKWNSVHEEAAGFDDPWPGFFYGLWLSAACTASSARQAIETAHVSSEPSPLCTACGHREALHGDNGHVGEAMESFWKSIVGSAGCSSGAVRVGESLCAVCAMRRMAGVTGDVLVPEGYRSIVRDDEYAMVVMSLDQPQVLLRGGKELKQAATAADCVHSELDKTFVKRSRAQVKEILDTPPVLGPARHLSVQEALDGPLQMLPSVLAQHGAFAVHATSGELVMVAPAGRAYALAKAMRAYHQEAFLRVPTDSGERLALCPGALATVSAVVAIVPRQVSAGMLLDDCRAVLQQVARRSLGGDAIVFHKRHDHEPNRVLAAHWSDLQPSLDTLLEQMPSRRAFCELTREMVAIASALSNPDLDKVSPTARTSLMLSAIEGLGLGETEQDRQVVARSVCQLVDHCVRFPGGVEESHALDGLYVAASLCGADQ